MFTQNTWEKIVSGVNKNKNKYLEIVLSTSYGPTAFERSFKEGLENHGFKVLSAINWWSASSFFGALEIEIEDNIKVYAIWCLGEKNEVIKITPKDDVDLNIIIESLASSNVAPGVMRTFSHARFPGG